MTFDVRRSVSLMAPFACLVAVLDQITKFIILAWLDHGERVPVIDGFFDLTLTYNPGAAFGFLANVADDTLRHTLLGVTTFVALVAVLYVLVYDYYDDLIAQGALAAVIGGAIGNIIDRIRIGMVIDFLDFYIGTLHWPVFNIADTAICLGVAVLLMRRPAQRRIQSAETEPV